MTNEYDFLKMSFHFSRGLPGIDRDPDNPLARASRSTLKLGKPHQKFSLCFYNDVEGEEENGNYRYKWFGVFELSSGGKLIFFPGFLTSTGIILSKGSQQEQYKFGIDHITLEQNLRRWHFTSNNLEHLGSTRTLELGGDRFLWFGFSLPNTSVLRDVSENTEFEVEVPSTDVQRRWKAFEFQRKRQDFTIVKLHDKALGRFNPGFLHFSLIVGPFGFDDYLGNILGIPFGYPFLKQQLPAQLENFPIRSHRVSLGSKIHIQVIAMWLPGALGSRVVITGA